jgi:hypothetical protein
MAEEEKPQTSQARPHREPTEGGARGRGWMPMASWAAAIVAGCLLAVAVGWLQLPVRVRLRARRLEQDWNEENFQRLERIARPRDGRELLSRPDDRLKFAGCALLITGQDPQGAFKLAELMESNSVDTSGLPGWFVPEDCKWLMDERSHVWALVQMLRHPQRRFRALAWDRLSSVYGCDVDFDPEAKEDAREQGFRNALEWYEQTRHTLDAETLQ